MLRTGDTVIPRYIHRIWIGGEEPEQYQYYGRTWSYHHPGWEVVQWDGPGDLYPLHNQQMYDNPKKWCPHGTPDQFRADLLRYEILYQHGGMYVDADFECLAPVGHLIEDTDLFAGWAAQDERIANGFMGCSPEHEFLAQLITGVDESIRRNGRRCQPTKLTGPQYLTAMYKWLSPDMHVLPQRWLYPYSYCELGTEKAEPPWPSNAIAVHHWHNQRKRKGELPQ